MKKTIDKEIQNEIINNYVNKGYGLIKSGKEYSSWKFNPASVNISKIFISPLLAFIASPSVLIFTKLF